MPHIRWWARHRPCIPCSKRGRGLDRIQELLVPRSSEIQLGNCEKFLDQNSSLLLSRAFLHGSWLCCLDAGLLTWNPPCCFIRGNMCLQLRGFSWPAFSLGNFGGPKVSFHLVPSLSPSVQADNVYLYIKIFKKKCVGLAWISLEFTPLDKSKAHDLFKIAFLYFGLFFF